MQSYKIIFFLFLTHNFLYLSDQRYTIEQTVDKLHDLVAYCKKGDRLYRHKKFFKALNDLYVKGLFPHILAVKNKPYEETEAVNIVNFDNYTYQYCAVLKTKEELQKLTKAGIDALLEQAPILEKSLRETALQKQ